MKEVKYALEDDYEFDFSLIGISCHEKDYRLCWAINQELELSMSKEEEDIEVIVKKSNRYSLHAMFTYFDVDNEVDYRLIANRSTMGFLIPEMPQADYLFMISNDIQFDFARIKAAIKNISFVLTTFDIDVHSLKSKDNLIF